MAVAVSVAGPLPLTSLNHISLVCRSIDESMDFYENVLGFVPIKRPGSFDFDGACLIVFLWLNFLNGPKEPGLWNLRLFNYGIGIHLLQSDDPDNMPVKKTEINPRDCHISFQCESMQMVEKRLQEMKQKYVKRRVEEGGMFVDQMFIHDPDGFMIEMCNCENLPVIPLGSPACIRCPKAISIEQPSPLSCKTWVPSTSTTQGLTYGH